jgi:hypothetical protein
MGRFGRAATWGVSVVGLAWAGSATAFELTGAWTLDTDKCNQVFVQNKTTNRLDFAEFPGVYGGGFIAEPDRLRSKYADCRIKTKKEQGQDLNLIAACATDIMLSDVQFVLRVVDDETIIRLFPGIESIETNYHRCRL